MTRSLICKILRDSCIGRCAQEAVQRKEIAWLELDIGPCLCIFLGKASLGNGRRSAELFAKLRQTQKVLHDIRSEHGIQIVIGKLNLSRLESLAQCVIVDSLGCANVMHEALHHSCNVLRHSRYIELGQICIAIEIHIRAYRSFEDGAVLLLTLLVKQLLFIGQIVKVCKHGVAKDNFRGRTLLLKVETVSVLEKYGKELIVQDHLHVRGRQHHLHALAQLDIT